MSHQFFVHFESADNDGKCQTNISVAVILSHVQI